MITSVREVTRAVISLSTDVLLRSSNELSVSWCWIESGMEDGVSMNIRVDQIQNIRQSITLRRIVFSFDCCVFICSSYCVVFAFVR